MCGTGRAPLGRERRMRQIATSLCQKANKPLRGSKDQGTVLLSRTAQHTPCNYYRTGPWSNEGDSARDQIYLMAHVASKR